MKILGIMSGTSMDGLDCCYAHIEINDNFQLNYKIIDFKLYPFNKILLKIISNSLGNKDINKTNHANDLLGKFFLECSKDFIKDKKIDIISIHGQTISHIDGHSTKQIGNPKYLKEYFNIPIIHDFRNKDIKLGGKGAPLVPFLDWLLYKDKNINTITLNLGGIANISFIPKNGQRNDVIGFDSGPGMCLIDQFSNIIWNKRLDFNAENSKKGKINDDLLFFLLEDEYICREPPKSTSRENYNKEYLFKIIKNHKKISYYDFIRTLVNFTAKSVSVNIERFLNIDNKTQLIISGGGANHPLLINDLKKNINVSKILKFKDKKMNIDSKESFLIALMGYTRFNNISNNMKNVTGASKGACYGTIYE